MEQTQLSLGDIQIANDTTNLNAICEESGSWRKFPLEVISDLSSTTESNSNRLSIAEEKVSNLEVQSNTNTTNISNLGSSVSGLTTRTTNLESKSNATTDYIVAQGTSGIWTYRKWNSGIAELWGRQYVSVDMTAGWGSMYESSAITLPNFPFTFTSIASATASWTNGSCAAMLEYFNPTTSAGGVTYLARASSYSGNGYISMRIDGRWK